MGSDTQQTTSFLPDFCGVRMVFVVVLIAELLAIILTLEEITEFGQSSSTLAIKSLFIQWMALSSIAGLCLLRPYLNHLPDHWAITLAYTLMLFICLVITEVSWWMTQLQPALGTLIKSGHFYFVFYCMGISAIVSALTLRYFYVQHQWRKQIELQAEVRIQALQARIRPHFLFNCMNSIASLTRKDPKLAEQTVEDLADLFRVSMQDARNLSTLGKEIDLCKRYLRIETHRLGKRLTTNWQIDIPAEIPIPSLILQPVIENAIYHGIELMEHGGTINISGEIRDDCYTLVIDNPLPLENEPEQHSGNQLALENIKQRIHAHFGNRGKLETLVRDNRYVTEITIPRHAENTDR